ncbi:MAG: hypothetical protein HYY30_09790 [Chloroflexi bacterium]|nr:hypothetical protein [Chloroflexota bacterium]
MPNSESGEWRNDHAQLLKVLKRRLGHKDTCLDVIADYEKLVRSIWGFTDRLLGDVGASAVLTRAVELAARDVPLLRTVHVSEQGVHFNEFRDHVTMSGCTKPEVLDALLRLGVMIFQILSELTGEAVTEPLLHELEQNP